MLDNNPVGEFDQILRDKINTHDQAVPHFLWENIEGKLTLTEGVVSTTKSSFFKWFVGTLIISSCLLVFWFLFISENDVFADQEVIQNIRLEINSDAILKKKSFPKEDDDIHLNITSIAIAPNKEVSNISKSDSTEDWIDVNQHIPSTAGDLQTQLAEFPVKDIEITEGLQEEEGAETYSDIADNRTDEEIPSSEKSMPNSDRSEVSPVEINHLVNNESSGTENDFHQSALTLSDSLGPIAAIPENIDTPVMGELDSIKKKGSFIQVRFGLAPFIGPINLKNLPSDEKISFTNQKSFKLELGKEFSPNNSLLLGIGFCRTEFNHQLKIRAENYSSQTTFGEFEVNNSEGEEFDILYSNQFDHLTFGVNFIHQVKVKENVEFHFLSGLTAKYLSNHPFDRYHEQMFPIFESPFSGMNISSNHFRQFLLSGELGYGANVKIFGNYFLTLDSRLSTSFNSFVKKDNINLKPVSLGFNLGLKRHF